MLGPSPEFLVAAGEAGPSESGLTSTTLVAGQLTVNVKVVSPTGPKASTEALNMIPASFEDDPRKIASCVLPAEPLLPLPPPGLDPLPAGPLDPLPPPGLDPLRPSRY